MENKKKGGGLWSSRRCGDGGNPLRAAWTMRPGLAIVSNLSLSLQGNGIYQLACGDLR